MDKKNDIFNELIKDKLTNYSLPVDDDSWNKIEERLNHAPERKAKRLWIATIAVAASVALLFLFLPNNKKTYINETANQLSDHEERVIQNVPDKDSIQSVLQKNVEHSPVFRKSQSGKRLEENNLTVEVIPKEAVTEENQAAPEKEEQRSVPVNRPAPTASRIVFEKEEPAPPVSKRKKRQSIRLSIGSGGNLFALNNVSDKSSIFKSTKEYWDSNMSYNYSLATVEDIAPKTAKDILSSEAYPNAIHHLPLSFGITVKKELNQTIAIESGIVYSFLATTFSRQSNMKSDADLQLHYIGIPLNLHVRIHEDRASRWELYLSAGGMVEKGILSHFVKKDYPEGFSATTSTLNERIKGLQWSLNLSPGIDYKIHKNYSIYLEPRVSYYFDNDQPESARTEYPVGIGINAGVRYSW